MAGFLCIIISVIKYKAETGFQRVLIFNYLPLTTANISLHILNTLRA